ncbi:hypothetical protein DICPUDRAFT_151904 [Dictyostelium purpureum]|uniref:Lipase maturation factor 2 n=1 Tax=Dictyostelium purpureum TaxID=5786 RepID=F0ZK19_DICPU|nr:uncharacterized protein DICPUDRAFT_151904 [Dictyostelium purpureum]EGC35702.1 hypothetical protein DICPUDRAFT_151904 [Dictyostelium purpureum]|eukprot:XP_003287758.1 hypothetical protein DICPUDRAFT_151904 [Dictyostelium purpureum]
MDEDETIYQSINNGGASSAINPTEASLADYITKKNKLKSIKENQRKKSYYLSTWIFLKMISIITFIALFSAFIQIRGLVGDDGILPVSKVLESKIATNEINSIWIFFTHPSKGMGFSVNNTLHMLCFIGLTFSALSIFTTTIATYIGLMWFCYYCIVDVGQLFFAYQWDQLLLETLFLTIFLSPFNPKYEEKPSTPIRYLLKWLLFRLVFGSGLVKLTPIWAGLQAMNYHYETQCIPNVFSWYLNQLPPVFHQFESMMVLAIEILLPALYFAPRSFRLFSSFTTVIFQMVIFLTGNYNFFNYLTIGLCALLLDDAFLLQLPMPEKIRIKLLEIESRRFKDIQLNRQSSRSESGLSSLDPKNLLVPFVFILIGTSSLINVSQYFQKHTAPLLIQRIHSALSLYHLTGTYGLFSHVTTERYEIIIEGSYDQVEWSPYEFYYKPGNLSRHPPFVFPGHQPRLDWQMWFAALSKDSNSQPWLIHFMAKLLEGSPEVLSLVEYSPFPVDKPPSFVRAQKYRYQFTYFSLIHQKNLNLNQNPNQNKDQNKEHKSINNNNKKQDDNQEDNNNQNNIKLDNSKLKKESTTKQVVISENDWWQRDFVGPFVKPFSLKSRFYLNFLSNEKNLKSDNNNNNNDNNNDNNNNNNNK